MRPLGILLSLVLTFPTLADIRLRVFVPTSIDESGRAPFRVVVTNLADAPAADVRVNVWMAQAGLDVPADVCTLSIEDNTRADCEVDLAPLESRTIELAGRTRTPSQFLQAGAALAGSSVMDFDIAPLGRTFLVTTLADSGAGSLRQAIEGVNRECATEACAIRFAAAGVIRLETALPRIRGSVDIVGTNVMLDGSALREGHGLQFASGFVHVTDLAIGNFPGNGIEAAGGYFRRNVISGNGLRGISIVGGSGRVVDNVLIYNRHSGGFFWTSSDVHVYGNVVEGNGASGLFFHKPSISVWSSSAFDNVIAGNAHAGLGLSANATGDYAKNAFRGNAGQPIDFALDGETRETRNGIPGQGGRLGAPIVMSARWDGTATVIEGRLSSRPTTVSTHDIVYVYAGANGTEEVIAVMRPLHGFAGNMFTARVERDLRGQLVRAAHFVNFIYDWDTPAAATSELSAPLPVQ